MTNFPIKFGWPFSEKTTEFHGENMENYLIMIEVHQFFKDWRFLVIICYYSVLQVFKMLAPVFTIFILKLYDRFNFLQCFFSFTVSKECTGWKVSKCGGFSGPYFPAFGLNTEIYSVNLRIESEYRKMQTRKNSVFGHFSRSVILQVWIHLIWIFVEGIEKHFQKHVSVSVWRNGLIHIIVVPLLLVI